MAGVASNGRIGKSPARISTGASVIGASEIEIAATPEAAWEVLTKFERWPSWNLDVKSVSAQVDVAPRGGVPVEVGRRDGDVNGPARCAGAVGRLDRHGPGTKAIHVWRLERRDGKSSWKRQSPSSGLSHGCFAVRSRRASTPRWPTCSPALRPRSNGPDRPDARYDRDRQRSLRASSPPEPLEENPK
jgi:hypothetical protein